MDTGKNSIKFKRILIPYLSIFGRYEMSNCLFEAAFENILERCKCAPGFHTIGGEEAMDKYEICMGANLTCMNDLMNRMGRFFHDAVVDQMLNLIFRRV